MKKKGMVVVSIAQRNSNKVRTEKGRLNSMVRSLVLPARVVPVECWGWAEY